MTRHPPWEATRDRKADVMLLAEKFFDSLEIDDCEYGGIGLDSKRPFGNSDANGDILEIIGADPDGDDGDDGDSECWSSEQREYAQTLYHEDLIPCLKGIWEQYKHEF